MWKFCDLWKTVVHTLSLIAVNHILCVISEFWGFIFRIDTNQSCKCVETLSA